MIIFKLKFSLIEFYGLGKLCWKCQIILFLWLWETRAILYPKKRNKCQGILPINMFASLEIRNIFIYDVFTDDIANIICQFHHLYLGQ